MNNQIEKKIIELIKKGNLTKEENLELIDNLYWADWDFLDKKYPEIINKIFHSLIKENISNQEISLILKLYNNPYGAYIAKFANIVVNLYNEDKMKFIKSLNLVRDEIINLVYIFRAYDIKLNKDQELLNMINSEELTEDEKETIRKIIKMYENICST